MMPDTITMIAVLDNIRSALNVGSIIRTCDAFGINEIYLCGITPDLKSEKVKKTALGAENSIKAKYFSSTKEAIKELKIHKYKVIALEVLDSAKPISEANVNNSLVGIVVGNEVSGVSEDILNICDETLMIPMIGRKESINVAVAFGIAAYCLTRKKCVECN